MLKSLMLVGSVVQVFGGDACCDCIQGGGGAACASRCTSQSSACQTCVQNGGGSGCINDGRCSCGSGPTPSPPPSPTPSGGSCSYTCSEKSASSWSFGTNGVNLLSHFEGFRGSCYKDSEGIWTIGIGHACQSSSDDLPQYGVTCNAGGCSGSLTFAQAESVLQSDLSSFKSCVQNAVKVSVTQNQFDALVSFAFNVGCGSFQTSTLLSELNSGKLSDKEAQYQFTRWHSGCTAGLERRRYTESQLFSTCSSSFACDTSGCSLSYNYPDCSSNCEYCSACGGCSGSSQSLPECVYGSEAASIV